MPKFRKFRRGQKVYLAREFTWHGKTLAQNDTIRTVPVGTRGVTMDDSWDSEDGAVVDVRWEGDYGNFMVDAACLELDQPITEEELAEVYRILGVSDATADR